MVAGLRRAMRLLTWSLGTVLAAYVAACVVARIVSPWKAYDIPDHAAITPPPGATLLSLRARDGVAVHALDLTRPKPGERTLVVFHGNGETIADWGDVAWELGR